MSLLFADSFDHYTDFADKGWNVNGTTTAPAIAAGEGRTAACAKWSTTSTTVRGLSFVPTRASSTSSGACGFAIKVTGIGNQDGSGILNGFFFSPLQSGVAGLYLRLNMDGTLTLLRAEIATTVLATTSGGFVDGVWAFVECEWDISDTGSFKIWIDGAQVMDFSGDTLSGQTALATWESVALFKATQAWASQDCVFGAASGKTITIHLDDFYLLDLEGSHNTSRLGNVTVECLLPQTDAVDPGAHADWTCSSGSPEDHGAEVDDATPDDDTTYVYTDDTVKDSYNYPDMSVATATIFGVQVSTCAKKSDSGTAEFKNLARVTGGGGDHQGATTHSPADTGYVCYRDIWETNPDDDTVWTVGDVNGAEFGMERTA